MARDVSRLVSQLDLDEKAALLAGADLWTTTGIERLGIPQIGLTDGPNGARGRGLPAESAVTRSTATCVPCGSGLGATWDTHLIEKVGRLIGVETRMKACRVILGPTVNLHRSPLGGRNFESYSEDPLLAGRLGAAWVRGAQSEGVICTVKHFAGNESEYGKRLVDSVIDERTLRELHLLPFELAVREGGALGIMAAYNRLNGHYCADNEWLLRDVLREDWGFEGLVVTDWFAFARTEAALRAGLDLEMPGPGRAFGPALAGAVRSGRIDESDVDVTVERLLNVFDRIGALDDDPVLVERSEDLAEHRMIARDAAASSFVLLKNEEVLPLDVREIRTVAVIGPNANRAIIMGGGSSSLAVAERRSPLAALRDRFDSDVVFNFEAGVEIARTAPEIPASWLRSGAAEGLSVECFALDDLGGEVLHAEYRGAGTVLWFGMPPGVGSEFSWRATGVLTVPEAGRYTIVLVQTEPARLLIDGVLVLDGSAVEMPPSIEFFGRATGEQSIELELSPEKPLHIEMQSKVTAGMLLGAKLGIHTVFPADSIERAVAAAVEADAVVMVVGTDGDWDSEGHDRESLRLPGRQDELVERVLAVAPDAVVVVNAGAVVELPWASRCRALLQCWFGGVEMAEALADVLLGESDPGGRLPTTIPHRLEDSPSWGNFPGTGGRILYGERVLVGYRWYESRSIDVAFPFGHGLSYTQFEFGEPMLSGSRFVPGEHLVVRVPVTNVGSRSGAEVVQLYVEPPVSMAFRPFKELKAFAKVHLEPGESTVVELELDDRSFARWSDSDDEFLSAIARQRSDAPFMPPIRHVDAPGWVVDTGSAALHIGRSVADISHVVRIDVVGTVEVSDDLS